LTVRRRPTYAREPCEGLVPVLVSTLTKLSQGGPPRSVQLFTIKPFRPFSCRTASVLLRAKTPNGSIILPASSIPALALSRTGNSRWARPPEHRFR